MAIVISGLILTRVVNQIVNGLENMEFKNSIGVNL